MFLLKLVLEAKCFSVGQSALRRVLFIALCLFRKTFHTKGISRRPVWAGGRAPCTRRAVPAEMAVGALSGRHLSPQCLPGPMARLRSEFRDGVRPPRAGGPVQALFIWEPEGPLPSSNPGLPQTQAEEGCPCGRLRPAPLLVRCALLEAN